MALTGSNLCLKYFAMVFNLLFWLVGIGILSIAVWLRVDYANYVKVQDIQSYYVGTYVLMGTGLTMTCLGFFGCCGACRESQCLLGTFFMLLLVIFSVQVAASIWAFYNRHELRKEVRDGLAYSVKQEFGKDPLKTDALHLIQRELGCCGSHSFFDWRGAVWTLENQGISETTLNSHGLLEASSASGKQVKIDFYLPSSCCKPTEKPCPERVKVTAANISAVYQKGCADKLEERLQENIGVVAGMGIGIAVIEVFGMVFSLILCCALRRERFKF